MLEVQFHHDGELIDTIQFDDEAYQPSQYNTYEHAYSSGVLSPPEGWGYRFWMGVERPLKKTRDACREEHGK